MRDRAREAARRLLRDQRLLGLLELASGRRRRRRQTLNAISRQVCNDCIEKVGLDLLEPGRTATDLPDATIPPSRSIHRSQIIFPHFSLFVVSFILLSRLLFYNLKPLPLVGSISNEIMLTNRLKRVLGSTSAARAQKPFGSAGQAMMRWAEREESDENWLR